MQNFSRIAGAVELKKHLQGEGDYVGEEDGGDGFFKVMVEWRSGKWMLQSGHVTAFWSAVAKMHGASLHRNYRFRGVLNILLPKPSVQPAKAASRLGLPRALQDAVAHALALAQTRLGHANKD